MGKRGARKRGKTARVDTTEDGEEEYEECSVSASDCMQYVFKYSWVCWVYIKIILKLVTVYILKDKDTADKVNMIADAEAIADSGNSLNPLLRNMFSFFLYWDGIFLEYIKPSYLLILDEMCSIYYKDGAILVILYSLTVSFVDTIKKCNKEISNEKLKNKETENKAENAANDNCRKGNKNKKAKNVKNAVKLENKFDNNEFDNDKASLKSFDYLQKASKVFPSDKIIEDFLKENMKEEIRREEKNCNLDKHFKTKEIQRQ